MYRLLFAGMVAFAMTLPAPTVNAQSSQVMEQLYGQGVHAYHSGQMQNAVDAFSQAISMGTRDPRVYYFRGLAQSGTGNSAAASGDFMIGAQLEASASGRHYHVSRALERVQGPSRIELETARRNAKLAARGSTGSPGAIASPNVVGGEIPMIPDVINTVPGQVAPLQTNFPDVSGVQNPGTPFADPNANTMQTQPAVPAAPQEDPFGEQPTTPNTVQEDPFGAPTSPRETPPMEEDPFGEAPPRPAEAAEEMPAEPTEDPFGEPPAEPVKEDPFGEQPSEEPMEEDPFGEEPSEAPMEEDPFGEEPSEDPFGETPDQEPPMEDPFGEEGDVPPPPSEEDPFGEEGEEGGDGTP